jgi:Phasin protein
MEIRKMSGPNEKKPGKKKLGKGSRKAKPSQNQKPDQMPDEKPEPLQSHKLEQLASPEPEPPQSPEPEPLQSHQPEQLQSHQPEQLRSPEPEQLASEEQEPCQDGNKQFEPADASEPPLSVDFQTLATAYGNYTKKSFEQTQAFVEKLSGVRSLDKAVEIQTEFAKQAYETFVTESQKIRELYRGIAKQNLRPFEDLVARKTPTAH